MLRISSVKLSAEIPGKSVKTKLRNKLSHLLKLQESDILSISVIRRSLDARNKSNLIYDYLVDIEVKNEEKLLRRAGSDSNLKKLVKPSEQIDYIFPYTSDDGLKGRIIIIGTGPAGLFCGLYLSRIGLRPILLERGEDVEKRTRTVDRFWKEGILNPESNIQFGEGGAGTFSDGKLATLVKDTSGRNGAVIKEFVLHGASEEIIYDSKPHIGTDVLKNVVISMRNEIISNGGQVLFEHRVTDICRAGNEITVTCADDSVFTADCLICAIGHSSRDTLKMMYERGFKMEQKPFAVGFRVQHPQSFINQLQFGREDPGELGSASYKVTAKTSFGRGVFSFCMCPGGYVVNASSEKGYTAVNGMSYSGRNGSNANSAIVVAVSPEDYPSEHPLSGIEFQRELEKKAFELAKGKIPLQRYGDFKNKISGKTAAEGQFTVEPEVKGLYEWTDLSKVYPPSINTSFIEGMDHFDKIMPGFGDSNCILAGIESRTSCPVRVIRDENELVSSVDGVFPCGEGAGYAGGITSAAMDGIKVAEAVCRYLKN